MLGYSLSNLKNLHHLNLNLHDNQVGDYGLSQFTEGLQALKNLNSLELNLGRVFFDFKQRISDEGLEIFFKSISKLQNL